LTGLSFPSIRDDGTACCVAKLIFIDNMPIPYYNSYFCHLSEKDIYKQKIYMNRTVWDKKDCPEINRLIDIELADYNYCLPVERIAQFPVSERDMSNLLISGSTFLTHTQFRNIDEYIPADHLLVFNNTRVVRARIHFQKETGASIEIFCIEPLLPADYERSFNSKGEVLWKCIVGNLKKWKEGILSRPFTYKGVAYELTAEKLNPLEDAWEIRFTWNCPEIAFIDLLDLTGHIPLPPYISREDMEEDSCRYQTIYATIKGSVAAPTAGLHFSDLVFDKLRNKGVEFSEITLHVGAGTFQPIKSTKIADHDMHCEHFTVTKKTIETLLEKIGRIVAVGTTSVRTLESLYWIGIKLSDKENKNREDLSIGQWEPYKTDPSCSAETSLKEILDFLNRKGLSCLNVSTKILIIPGYKFRMTNGIITNFHQPGSTLLLLVSAWTGSKWKEIYNYALDNDFRFLSYGDCSLLF
jgi:S-adenosylmethionine:tRNA ribosyltransferase-isomerase